MRFTINPWPGLVCSAALLCASGGAWVCAGGTAPEADSAQAKARLAAVREHIAALTRQLGEELKRRDAAGARLRDAELGIAAKRVKLDALRAAIGAAQRRAAELRAGQRREQDALQSERAALAAQMRAAFMIGRREQLKLLLQSDPALLGRTLTYYGYFARQRSSSIEAIQDRERRLQLLLGEIEQQSADLAALEQDASRELKDLTHARAERAGALAALDQRVVSGNEQLADLKREEQAVETLVADLARMLQDFQIDDRGFEHMRGRLPWPVQGRVTTHFQERRANGEMIETTRGARVRAAYYGRVVYADWLQGLGLLLIVGHSGGYMTLYGHAEVLYKSVGDRVAPGDVIAAMSDADGDAPQLYFEIREGRKTLDPKIWLKSNP
jgi:septal ring factor EnvC (AmiA/AmiB activator)